MGRKKEGDERRGVRGKEREKKGREVGWSPIFYVFVRHTVIAFLCVDVIFTLSNVTCARPSKT